MSNRNSAENISESDADLEKTKAVFAQRLTPAVRALISHPHDPVGRQYIADIRELDTKPEENPDPIGDYSHTPVKGIVHRHQDRVLFKVTSSCAVNCRFCFRKNMLGTADEVLNSEDIQKALSYIEDHPEISEVILTGGDPLVLSRRRLSSLLDRLENIAHIQIIRIHSRVPMADPDRLTPEYCRMFGREKPVYMVVHANHAQEFSPQVSVALKNLHQSGAVLLSQSVLLRNINDNEKALEDLFRTFLRHRIKPYYLHHPDLVPGTSHFRVSIEKGQTLMRTLRKNVTGIALPTYVLDIPGGYGKVLLEKAYIERKGGKTVVTDHHGAAHFYP